MTYYRNTGTKISEYTKLEIDKSNNKFKSAPSFICYASNMSGTNGINKNYQVPMQSIRTDVRGFVGLRNAKPSWNNMLSVWYGEYQSPTNSNNSYVKEWTENDATNSGYIADKFKDTNDGKDIITSRVFLLKNIPFPFEETTPDPKSSTHKIVDKKYVDKRLNGIRKVKIEKGQIIYLRPYQCLYCFNNEVDQISIKYDNLKSDDENGDKTGHTALNDEMFLEFYIEIPKPKTSPSTLSIEVDHNGSFKPVEWSFKDQSKSIIEASTDRVLIKCFANKSTNNQLAVRCTNAMNLEPGKGEGGVSIETTETISKENENSKKIPTQGAVVNYVNDTLDTLNDKLGSTISSIDGGDFIDVAVDDDETTKVNLTLKTTGDIKNVENEVPTSKAVYGHTNNQDIHVTKADKNSWNNKVSNISGDDFITTNGEQIVSLSLNTTDEIIDSDVHVPTSNAVYDHVKLHEDKNIHITSSERTSWNNHINNDDIHITDDEKTSWNNKISGIIEGDTIINCELNETSKSVTLSLKWDEVFKKSVCVCDIQSLEEDGKEYVIYDDSCSPKYISFAEKITNGESMFMNQLLKHFRINLHNMTNGKNMFMNCTLLQHFDSDLSSLTEAENMFGYCCLSLKSVKNIADKINTVTSGKLGSFGINIKYQNNEELNEALAKLTTKGWSYNVQYRNL